MIVTEFDEFDRRAEYDRQWDQAIREATYEGDVAYELCAGTLRARSQAYTVAFTAVMDRFRRRHACPQCGVQMPTGRCAHCEGV